MAVVTALTTAAILASAAAKGASGIRGRKLQAKNERDRKSLIRRAIIEDADQTAAEVSALNLQFRRGLASNRVAFGTQSGTTADLFEESFELERRVAVGQAFKANRERRIQSNAALKQINLQADEARFQLGADITGTLFAATGAAAETISDGKAAAEPLPTGKS